MWITRRKFSRNITLISKGRDWTDMNTIKSCRGVVLKASILSKDLCNVFVQSQKKFVFQLMLEVAQTGVKIFDPDSARH